MSKIYYFTGLNFPARMANRTTIMKTSEALGGLDLDFTLFVNRLSLPLDEVYEFYRVEHKFPVRAINIKTGKSFKSIWYALKYRNIYLEERPDLVFVREPKLAFFLRLFIGKKLKFIYELHNEGPTLIYRLLHKYILPRASGVVFITKTLESSVLSKYPKLKRKTATALMAFEPLLFGDDGLLSKSEAKKSLGIEAGRPVILYVGSTLDRWKGFDFFVDAAGILPDFSFFVVGGNDKAVLEWRQYAAEKNIKNINFIGYVGKKDDLLCYYRAADVLVSTTCRDYNDTSDSPMKIFEYMASGRPIVAMSGVVVEETLRDDINGFLVKERSAQALADKIRYAIENPALAEKMAKQAKEDSGQYTWQKRAEAILNLIYKIKD